MSAHLFPSLQILLLLKKFDNQLNPFACYCRKKLILSSLEQEEHDFFAEVKGKLKKKANTMNIIGNMNSIVCLTACSDFLAMNLNP